MNTQGRGLDHIVHTVSDLDAAGEFYARLGFTVGARNQHPWGTHNRIVQFSGVFIELLTVSEPDKIQPPSRGRYSFGAFSQTFLAEREGLSMLVLESRDAEADAQVFRKARIGDFDVFRFEREARKPDGVPVTVAFSLAFAEDGRSPQAGFFVCQQHFPENFWNPAFQTHPNGARMIGGVVLVAENPEDHRRFVSAFAGTDAGVADDGIAVQTPRGSLEVIGLRSFRTFYGLEPPDGHGMRLAALRFRVTDVDALATRLREAGLTAVRRMSRLIVGPAEAHGATLVFEQVS